MSKEAPVDNRSHTYLIHIWYEASGERDRRGEWRGEVRDVTTQAVVRFRQLAGIVPALRELGVAGQ